MNPPSTAPEEGTNDANEWNEDEDELPVWIKLEDLDYRGGAVMGRQAILRGSGRGEMSETRPDDATIMFDTEDGVDERGWVSVKAASTPEEAVALLAGDHPELDPHMHFCCDGNKGWYRETDDPWWQPCEPTDEGAEEFWEITLEDFEPDSPSQEGERV